MTEHSGLPVAGYQPQSSVKVELVNNNKQVEERLLRRVENLVKRDDVDKRWAAIARTHFEEGFMALNRAIFQPGRIDLPEDAERDV